MERLGSVRDPDASRTAAAAEPDAERVLRCEFRASGGDRDALVENAAAPVTAILIGPLTESVFMPFMVDGAGARAIGGWFGTGPERGIALLFTVAGLVGVIATIAALASRSYRRLAALDAAPAVA